MRTAVLCLLTQVTTAADHPEAAAGTPEQHVAERPILIQRLPGDRRRVAGLDGGEGRVEGSSLEAAELH